MIFALVRVSTKLRDTLEDSAPMTTDGLPATIWPADAVEIDMSVESPESRTWWQALAPLTPPAALMSEIARPTPATAGGPRKARLPVSGRMPPTLNALALVALASHLSFVKAAADPDGADVSEVSPDEVGWSLAFPESESSPQATRENPRAAPMATVAVRRLYRLVAMLDRFTS
jgi:hypothetical protein